MHGREAVEQAVRVGQPRGVEQGRRRRPLQQPARVHDGDLVGELDQQREVVGYEEGRESEPVTEPHQLLEDLPLGDHVEGGRGLVQDHDLGLQREGHGDHGALAHAAGELVRVAAQPVGVHAHHVEQLPRPLPALRPGELRAVRAQQVVELGADGDDRVERVQRALQDDRDLGPAHRAQLLWAG